MLAVTFLRYRRLIRGKFITRLVLPVVYLALKANYDTLLSFAQGLFVITQQIPFLSPFISGSCVDYCYSSLNLVARFPR